MLRAFKLTPEESYHLTRRLGWCGLGVFATYQGLYEDRGALRLLKDIICLRHVEIVDTDPLIDPDAILATEKCPFVRDLAYKVLEQNSK
jgi:hypothetical protein